MKKIAHLSTISSVIALAFIVPQIAFAAWWNPFSWNFFGLFRGPARTEVTTVTTQVATTSATTTDSSEKVLCNGQYWNKCPAGQLLVCPTDKTDAYCSTPKTPKTKTTPTVQTQSSPAVDSAAQQKAAQDAANLAAQQAAQNAPTGIYCNGKYWTQCPTGQTFSCPQSGSASCSSPQTFNTQTGKNYYIDVRSRLTSLSSIEKSYETWLHDTSEQFRSASLTLAGYNLGGLYGESRDAAIKLANANISVIGGQLTNTGQWVTYYQNMLDIVNKDPSGFLDETTLNKLKTPDSLQTELDGIKKSINSSLDSVMTALQYH